MIENRKQPTKTSTFIHNPAWAAASDSLVHGMITRRDFNQAGKLTTRQTIQLAAPIVQRLITDQTRSKPEQFTLVSADQVHGDHVVVMTSPDDSEKAGPRDATLAGPGWTAREFPQTDALVTPLTNLFLLIQTADCLPILFWDRRTKIIGACHCGWKGLMARLGQKTAQAMIDLGCRPESIEAWIAPGIRVENYEVSAELVESFAREFPQLHVSPDGRHLDLAQIAIGQLRDAGLQERNITDSGLCTFADPQTFHSYRRDGAQAGRLLTVIQLSRYFF